jgi:hypothetical protein
MMKRSVVTLFLLPALLLLVAAITETPTMHSRNSAEENAKTLIDEGRHVFRFDTFGDEAFWTDQLHMQQSVSKLSPRLRYRLDSR